MPKYKVKHTSILHNGTVYPEGKEIELTKLEAERLCDFVELLPEQKKTKTETEVKKTDETKTPKKSSAITNKTEKNETENTSNSSETEGGK